MRTPVQIPQRNISLIENIFYFRTFYFPFVAARPQKELLHSRLDLFVFFDDTPGVSALSALSLLVATDKATG